MPWCPKCKTEYNPSVTTCPDCGQTLVEKLQTEETDVFSDLGEPVKLTETADEFEADVLLSKLEASGIPAFLSYSGFGSVAKVYCGRSNFAVSVMVPSSLLDKAKDVIAPNQDYDFSGVEEMETPKMPKNTVFARLLLLFPALFALIIYLIYYFMNK